MTITTFSSGPFATNTYCFSCEQTKKCAIIDAAPGSTPMVQDHISKNQLTPVALLLTHSHWDHIADATNLKKNYNIPIGIHPEDRGNLEAPGSDKLPCWIKIPALNPDHELTEGTSIDVGSLHLVVIHTPGHTPGGICLYCPEREILFSGDTLFKGTIGNLSFPTARPELMWDSLKKLALLPTQTQVYPGHGSATTIGAENWLSRAEEIFG